MPPVVTSATSSGGDDGIVATANIKQEPGIAGEVTLNRWVTMFDERNKPGLCTRTLLM